MLAPYGLRTYKIYSSKSSVVRIRLLIVGKPRFDSVTLYALSEWTVVNNEYCWTCRSLSSMFLARVVWKCYHYSWRRANQNSVLGLVSRKHKLRSCIFSLQFLSTAFTRIILPAPRNQLQKLRISCLLEGSLNAHRFSTSKSCLLDWACALSPLRRRFTDR